MRRKISENASFPNQAQPPLAKRHGPLPKQDMISENAGAQGQE
jgi:hypothetical protein